MRSGRGREWGSGEWKGERLYSYKIRDFNQCSGKGRKERGKKGEERKEREEKGRKESSKASTTLPIHTNHRSRS